MKNEEIVAKMMYTIKELKKQSWEKQVSKIFCSVA